MRFEFQGRGTLHVHVIVWATLRLQASRLTGRTDHKHNSPFVRLLEDIFGCRVDVQAGDGHHNLLRYVAGYVSKASDALQFKSDEAKRHKGTASMASKWRQVYRLLCKRALLEQEIAMEFAGLPMVAASFTGPPPRTGNRQRD